MNLNPLLKTTDELNEMSRQIRRDIINMLLISGSGHSGGPLGMADIFTAMYFNLLNIDNENTEWIERDYFLLSAGHLAPVWYSSLARRGYFPLEELKTLRKINSRLQGHPAPAKTHGVPGIEIASGSLGQGLSIAVGCALGLKLDKKPNYVFCVNGDGELQEGQIWEAVMSAAHFKVDNLTMIVDNNDCQIDGNVRNIMNIQPLRDKFISFNWEVFEIDGNDLNQVVDAVQKSKLVKGKPTVILAKTVMGKGVSFMERDYNWHGNPPNEEQAKIALSELLPTKFGDFA
jgi:transketolase